jgi:[ribosomal protein S18]-alanine N-acetyltransferase
MNYEIKEFGVESAALLAELHSRSFTDVPEKVWNENDFSKLFSIAGTKSYVICLDDEPIGFILIRKLIDEAEIITFCILPKWCRNGYATVLLEWVIKKLQLRSVKRLFLEVRENNNAALKLYKNFSFVIIGRRKGYYGHHNGTVIDALVMQLQLN